MNIIKLTTDNDETVYINEDTITHVVEGLFDGAEVYVVGRKNPLYVNEEPDDIVKVLLKLDRKGEYE